MLPLRVACFSLLRSRYLGGNNLRLRMTAVERLVHNNSVVDDGYDNDDNNKKKKDFMAVVRYDNNVATVPFIGSEAQAKKLHDRMTKETHKHHVYLISTTKSSVRGGPFMSLEEARTALKDK